MKVQGWEKVLYKGLITILIVSWSSNLNKGKACKRKLKDIITPVFEYNNTLFQCLFHNFCLTWRAAAFEITQDPAFCFSALDLLNSQMRQAS